MKEFTFCELREREVVNVADGRKLGRVYDLTFSTCGKITGLIVPGEKKFLKNMSGTESIFVPWNSILKIGGDVILIDLNDKTTPPGLPGN